MNGGWGIALILVLVVINGIFVAAEFAIVKVRTTRITELADGGNRLARMARPMLNQVESYLPVIQLGVTMATLALGWVGEPSISALLIRLMVWIGVPAPVAVGSAAQDRRPSCRRRHCPGQRRRRKPRFRRGLRR